jgi:hypothetical protein
MSERPPNLVFISGCDRSGSTLLARLLGRVPGFVAVGELRGIWLRGLRNNQLCGCGAPFDACGFWTEVVREAFGSRDAAPVERMLRLRRAVDRMRMIPLQLVARPGARFARALGEYRETVGTLLQAVRRVSGAEVLVDSTKGPMSVLIYAGMPGVSLHVVHLARDSRGVARSFSRRKVNPSIHWETAYMRRKGTVGASLYWMTTNLLSHVTRRRAGGFTFLRYEDLAAAPAPVVDGLLTRLGREGRAAALIEGGGASFPAQHMIAGNPMRFRTGRVEIASDDEWKTGMPAGARLAVTALTWPLLLRYGYLGGGRGTAAGAAGAEARP